MACSSAASPGRLLQASRRRCMLPRSRHAGRELRLIGLAISAPDFIYGAENPAGGVPGGLPVASHLLWLPEVGRTMDLDSI